MSPPFESDHEIVSRILLYDYILQILRGDGLVKSFENLVISRTTSRLHCQVSRATHLFRAYLGYPNVTDL